jgi:hypothetical protein
MLEELKFNFVMVSFVGCPLHCSIAIIILVWFWLLCCYYYYDNKCNSMCICMIRICQLMIWSQSGPWSLSHVELHAIKCGIEGSKLSRAAFFTVKEKGNGFTTDTVMFDICLSWWIAGYHWILGCYDLCNSRHGFEKTPSTSKQVIFHLWTLLRHWSVDANSTVITLFVYTMEYPYILKYLTKSAMM